MIITEKRRKLKRELDVQINSLRNHKKDMWFYIKELGKLKAAI